MAMTGNLTCPKCDQDTASECKDGSWECSNGCNLAGYHPCPHCSSLYDGHDAFCSNACENAAQGD